MFANPDGCDEKMSVRIKIISLHNGKKIVEKQFKNNGNYSGSQFKGSRFKVRERPASLASESIAGR